MRPNKICQKTVSMSINDQIQGQYQVGFVQIGWLRCPKGKIINIKGTRIQRAWNGLTSRLVFMLVTFYMLTGVYCDCPADLLVETMYVDYQQYCTFSYDPCNNNTLIGCSKQQCIRSTSECNTIMEMTTPQACKRYCCQGSQLQQNFNNVYSLQLCRFTSNSNSRSIQKQPITFIKGYVFIGIFGAGFILISIAFCICKRYQNQQTFNPNHNNAGPNLVYPSTSVDLNAYDINAEGPYFVNSNDSCVICLDKNVNLRTHCNHFYHGNCLLAWLKKKANNPCPLCMGINYNPIKVYCQQCHSGDILVNIQPQTSTSKIKEYDTHKCQNCKRFGNQSFTLSDEGNHDRKRNDAHQEMLKEKEIQDYNNEWNSENQEPRDRKLQRNNQRVYKLQNAGVESKKQRQKSQKGQQLSSSGKKLYQRYNKTSILP